MKAFQLSRNFKVVISTVLILVTFYLFYTQVYTKNREEKLIQTRFRVLDQMGKNVKTKLDSYKNNANIYENEVYSFSILDDKIKKYKTDAAALNEEKSKLEKEKKDKNEAKKLLENIRVEKVKDGASHVSIDELNKQKNDLEQKIEQEQQSQQDQKGKKSKKDKKQMQEPVQDTTALNYKIQLDDIQDKIDSIKRIKYFHSQLQNMDRDLVAIDERLKAIPAEVEKINAKIDSLKKDTPGMDNYFMQVSKDKLKSDIEKYSKLYNDDLVFVDKKANLSKDALIYVNLDSVLISSQHLKFYLPEEFLLKNINRKDVFEQSLIIADSSIIYSSLDEDLKITFITQVKDGKQSKGLSLISRKSSDTIFMPVNGMLKAATIHSNRCYDISLSDGPYKLFLKPVEIDHNDWFIGGLIKTSDFQREKQSIAPWLIILLSLSFVLIILSLPFIKLRAMSKTELIGKNTIFHVALACLLGVTFLVFYIFFQANYFYRISESDIQLKALSKELSGSIETELESIHNVLVESDKEYIELSRINKNINETDILVNPNWNIRKYPFFDYIFWLDKNGQQIAQISPFDKQENLINVSKRNYFLKRNQWFWQDENNQEQDRFMMESIMSVKSGDYKVAFSVPSLNQDTTVVLTGRFFSLIDPIIPKGYAFCIMDEKGNVWFHSNKYQNLAENLIEECDDDRRLKAALYSGISKSMNVSYFNNPYRIHLQRMKMLPLYLVTMHDLRHDYSFQSQTFITTLLLTTGLFLYLFVQLIVLLLLKKKYADKDEDRKGFQVEFSKFRPSILPTYKKLNVIILTGIILAYVFIYQMPAAAAIISIFMTTTVFLTVLFYYLQHYEKKSRAIKIYLTMNRIILAILVIFAAWIYKEGLFKIQMLFFWIFLLILSVAVLVSLTSYSEKYNQVLSRLKKVKLVNKISGMTGWTDLSSERAYSLMIFILIFAFGIMPMLKFYNISSSMEDENFIRYGQLELAKSRELRNLEYAKYYQRIENKPGEDFVDTVHRMRLDTGIFTKFWYGTVFDTSSSIDPKAEGEGDILDSILNPFRPVYGDPLSLSSKFLFVDSVANRPFNWHKSNKTIEMNYNSPSEDIAGRAIVNGMVVRSELPKARVLMPFRHDTGFRFFKSLLFILLIISLFFLSYRLILLTTRRLFGISLIKPENATPLEESLKENLSAGIPVLLINPYGMTRFHEFVTTLKVNFKLKEIKWDEKEKKYSGTGSVIIKDLMKDYDDPQAFSLKMKAFLDYLQYNSNVVIVSGTHPGNILKYYRNYIEGSKPKDSKADKKPDDSAVIYLKTNEQLGELLTLINTLDVPVDYLPKNDSTSLQETYYQALVNTCSPEELFVLLDLSRDSIANIKNKPVILRLLNRGLLKKEKDKDDIIIADDGLKDFLLNKYTKEELNKLKSDMAAEPGHWTGFKYAIILVIIALFIFIFMSNQEFLNNINKLFVTLGASIAGITSLFNMVVRKNT